MNPERETDSSRRNRVRKQANHPTPFDTKDSDVVLWVDLRQRRKLPDLGTSLARSFPTSRLNDSAAIPRWIRACSPALACFDFDFPDSGRLEALQRTKSQHPSLPILMLTDFHSEALAVWALRSRVWDYLRKPIPFPELLERVRLLLDVPKRNGARRKVIMPLPPTPADGRTADIFRNQHHKLMPALAYINENYSEPVRLAQLARLCGLGAHQFCRTFKRENGIGFREFLIRQRVSQAMKFLQDPRRSVTDVAFAVGFNDLSHFSRLFRRYVGTSPRQYRQQSALRNPSLPIPEALKPPRD